MWIHFPSLNLFPALVTNHNERKTPKNGRAVLKDAKYNAKLFIPIELLQSVTLQSQTLIYFIARSTNQICIMKP